MFNRTLKNHSDERYDQMKKRSGVKSNFKYYLFQYSLQSLLIFPCMLPAYIAATTGNFNLGFAILGSAISLYGTINEAISDKQLEEYKAMKSKGMLKDQNICSIGHWKYSRHPNLFFEIVHWTGIAVTSLTPNLSFLNLLAFSGPLFLFYVIRNLTLPITEKAMKMKRPNWADIKKNTNILWPYSPPKN